MFPPERKRKRKFGEDQNLGAAAASISQYIDVNTSSLGAQYLAFALWACPIQHGFPKFEKKKKKKNIARGTTDPEIDSVTWIELGNKIAPLTLVAYLATRWRHLHYLQIWPTDGAIYISCKFGLQMAPLA